MSKSSIKDATVRIKPSAALCAYIASVQDVSTMPENVRAIYQLHGGASAEPIAVLPRGDVELLAKPALTNDDLEYLRQLNNTSPELSGETFQLTNVLETMSSDDDDESDDDDIDHDDGGGKTLSKTRAKKLKEQRKERQKRRARLALPDLIWLNALLVQRRKNAGGDSDEAPVYLHQLLVGSKLVLPRNEIVERDPVLEARCVRLRLEQDARVYNAMTKNVDTSRRQLPDDTIAYQMKAINKQMIAVAQFLFSVAAGFAFGFIGVELLIGNLDFGFRLLLGIICALVIALAEIYFLAKQLNEEYDISVAQDKVELKGPEAAAAALTAGGSKPNPPKALETKSTKPHAE